jgi:alpha-glucosidase
MLALYRAALRLRKARRQLDDDAMSWHDDGEGVLAFSRPGGLMCVLNTSASAAELPAHDAVLLASDDLADGMLPPDCAVWLLVG